MSYHQPDPSNAPALSVRQQFEIFTRKGGLMEEFALETTVRNANKIFAIEAHPINGGSITFLGGMVRIDKNPEIASLMITKINRTLEILTGIKPTDKLPDSCQNLGINSIGYR